MKTWIVLIIWYLGATVVLEKGKKEQMLDVLLLCRFCGLFPRITFSFSFSVFRAMNHPLCFYIAKIPRSYIPRGNKREGGRTL